MASSDQAFDSLDSNIPHLLMLFLQQQNDSGSLGVERAGDMKNGVLYNTLDGVVGDRTFALETIVSTAVLNQLQKRGGSSVLEFDSSGAHCESVVRNEDLVISRSMASKINTKTPWRQCNDLY